MRFKRNEHNKKEDKGECGDWQINVLTRHKLTWSSHWLTLTTWLATELSLLGGDSQKSGSSLGHIVTQLKLPVHRLGRGRHWSSSTAENNDLPDNRNISSWVKLSKPKQIVLVLMLKKWHLLLDFYLKIIIFRNCKIWQKNVFNKWLIFKESSLR